MQLYQKKSVKPLFYNLEDHPQLAEGSFIRQLFDNFRREVIALDPIVTEEIRKSYVAFKAETNFVDVVPQKSRLVLTLNMAFHELNDPRSMAKDVTGVGRWGNGNIEIGLSDHTELLYVMGLVRQAYEKQI